MLWPADLSFSVVYWGGSTAASDTKRLNILFGKTSFIIRCKRDTTEAVMERRTLNKLVSIMDNPEHPLHPVLYRLLAAFSRG